jgi:hypothetical protein
LLPDRSKSKPGISKSGETFCGLTVWKVVGYAGIRESGWLFLVGMPVNARVAAQNHAFSDINFSFYPKRISGSEIRVRCTIKEYLQTRYCVVQQNILPYVVLCLTYFDMISKIKGWVVELTDVVLCLLALAIVVTLLVGQIDTNPFGNVANNIVSFVGGLAKGGLAGLVSIGIILWLFSRK